MNQFHISTHTRLEHKSREGLEHGTWYSQWHRFYRGRCRGTPWEFFTSNNIISWSSSFPCCHLPLWHCSPISTVVLCSLSLSLIRIPLPLLLHYNLIPWWYHEMKRTKEKLSISVSGKENIQSLYLYLYSIPFLIVLILLVPFYLILIVEQNRLQLICDRVVSPPTYPLAHILMWESSTLLWSI